VKSKRWRSFREADSFRAEPKQPEDFDFRDADLSQSRKNAGSPPELFPQGLKPKSLLDLTRR
jgi:hypothetical protein